MPPAINLRQGASKDDAGALLRQRRLLMDIKELVEKPYPNITLHTYDFDLSAACLVLTPEEWKPLHLTVHFSPNYPVDPPRVKMDSLVFHPNVFDGYICATILRRTEEHTPAYTLKGIAMQLLSFFSGRYVEQEEGGKEDLEDFREFDEELIDNFHCQYCHFGGRDYRKPSPAPRAQKSRNRYDARVDTDPNEWPALSSSSGSSPSPKASSESQFLQLTQQKIMTTCEIDRLPNELIVMILEKLDFDQLTKFAAAWPRVSNIIRDFDIMRQRELQCYCLKQDYRSVKLGVGVSIYRGQIASEFDLLSQDAYKHWKIRRAVNNISFDHWLPLPISHQHWRRVKGDVKGVLSTIQSKIKNVGPFGEAQVLFTFMNDVVVRLNQVAESKRTDSRRDNPRDSRKSNLRHASEKAIDSYFHLFHLLVCLATENPSLVEHANSLLRTFMDGKQSKTDCPNLGHLLIALLISDIEVTDALRKAIIIEAITRNVVWLLDRKGAGMAELSFIEPGPVSAYRLNKTFEGSRTSYRLLMFSELFRRTARPSHTKPLTQVRDELFERHGAPPHNAAQELSETVRRLHTINDFPAFLKEMGLQKIPDARTFTDILRKTVLSSMSKGYSTWAMPSKYALLMRVKKDNILWANRRLWLSGDDARWLNENWKANPHSRCKTFFPHKGKPRGPRNGGT
ncbi:hypothetical protein F4805DRAFT_435670 [Annulohypoxylon moriforme]|nr:hypothetical protein F4805DRAFT_435670 [Annulohypoxylon moriforme]